MRGERSSGKTIYLNDFWGKVAGGAAKGGGGGRTPHLLLAHAKVGNFDVAIASNHHVVKFQIPARIRDCMYFYYGKPCKMNVHLSISRETCQMSVAGATDG